MKNYYIYLFAFVSLVLTPSVFAGEINYATIEEIKDEKVLIKYSGPSQTSFWLCDVENYECDEKESDSPVFPEIKGVTDYVNSPDGKYGILKETDTKREGSPVYTIYRIGNGWKVKNNEIPFYSPTERITISPDSSHVFLFGVDGKVARYDIGSQKIKIKELSQNTFPLRIVSPKGRYLAAFNYTDPGHRVWDFEEDRETKIHAQKASFVEFSENEEYAAFVDDRDGFERLYIFAPHEDDPKPEVLSQEKGTVADYLFVRNNLYLIANTKDNPYDWILYEYNTKEGKVVEIAENVSYGDYIARTDGQLLFLTIEGKNTNLSIYNPETQRVRTIDPLGASRLPQDVERKVLKTGNNFGALLEHDDKDFRSNKLFIWLHGGPQRQTSPAYHSYLSYAVYDELLDRLVMSGATVLKLDYSGSWGYGKDFIDKLDERIGKTDVSDVVSAAEELENSYDEIYLIGNSYGGYLAARSLVEKPDLFQGAISINGVLDWATLIERIPSSPFSRLFNGIPNEENVKLYKMADIKERLTNLKDQKVFLIYGEKDSTVPVWQTTEFHEKLLDADINVTVLPFSDEDHILRKRDNLNDLCHKITDWADLGDEACKD